MVVAPAFDRALARWCFTVEWESPSRWAAAFSEPAATTAVRQRIARWSAAAAGGLYLLFIVLLVMVVSNPTVIEYGMAPLLVATLSVGVAAAVLTVVVLVQAVLTWRNGDWRLVTRIHSTAVAVALVALGWQMNHWNLLGFHV